MIITGHSGLRMKIGITGIYSIGLHGGEAWKE
jgi:hypothetical protein